MTEIMKTKLRAVAMLLYIFAAVVTSAGAISTLEGIYIAGGVCNLLCAAYVTYKEINKKN